jgi:hypothetical protein
MILGRELLLNLLNISIAKTWLLGSSLLFLAENKTTTQTVTNALTVIQNFQARDVQVLR